MMMKKNEIYVDRRGTVMTFYEITEEDKELIKEALSKIVAKLLRMPD